MAKGVWLFHRGPVWKGHVCTIDVRKFKSPLVRALLLKGHAFKVEEGEESLLRELYAGLMGTLRSRKRGQRFEVRMIGGSNWSHCK